MSTKKDKHVAGEVSKNQNTSAPRKSTRTDKWRDLLHKRGLSDATIGLFQITEAEGRQSWKYPVAPSPEPLRCKGFPGNRFKYCWATPNPDIPALYDPNGTLGAQITAADGVLWLASGEPDVWALHEGGIPNATCLLRGEATPIPEDFVMTLQSLQVRQVHVAPDRDATGMKFAQNLTTALAGSGIELITHQLPFTMGSKGDINKYLLKVGADELAERLVNLPPLAVAASKPVIDSRPETRSANRETPDFERHTKMVEEVAVSTWHIPPPNAQGFSRDNFCCPFHDDHAPSASWNYKTHSLYCFADGKTYNIHQVAEFLGLPSWENWKASQRKAKASKPVPTTPQPAIEPTVQSTSPSEYDVIDNRIVHLREKGKEGEQIAEAIVDGYFERMIEVIYEPPLQSLFRLRGFTPSGQPISLDIAKKDFEEVRDLKSAISAALPADAALYPGMHKHLPIAIKRTTPRKDTVRAYKRTGWVDEARFLIPGRVPDCVEIELDEKLPFQLDGEANLDEALAALRHLIECVGPRNSLIPLVCILGAPALKLTGLGDARFATFIHGHTNTFKTSWLMSATSIWGAGFAEQKVLTKFGEGATNNALMARAAQVGDLPFPVDNYKPNTGRGEEGFINLVHNMLEGSDRDRANSDGSLQLSRQVRCHPIFTGEDLPLSDPATLSRLVPVSFDHLPSDASEHLTHVQRRTNHMNAIGSIWIDFLESPEGRHAAEEEGKTHASLREAHLERLAKVHKGAAGLSRIGSNSATLQVYWQLLLRHPVLGPVFQPYTAEFQAALDDFVSSAGRLTGGHVACFVFKDAVEELIATGQCVLSGDNYPGSRAQVIGQKNADGSVYLFSSTVMKAVEDLLGKEALGKISASKLQAQMDKQGWLERIGRNGDVVVAKVDGGSVRVFHFKAGVLGEDLDQE